MLRVVSHLNTQNLLYVKEAASVERNEPRVTRWIGYSSAALAVIAALNEGSVASSSLRRYREAPLKALTAPPLAPTKKKNPQKNAALDAFTEWSERGHWLHEPRQVRGCNTVGKLCYCPAQSILRPLAWKHDTGKLNQTRQNFRPSCF